MHLRNRLNTEQCRVGPGDILGVAVGPRSGSSEIEVVLACRRLCTVPGAAGCCGSDGCPVSLAVTTVAGPAVVLRLQAVAVGNPALERCPSSPPLRPRPSRCLFGSS